MSAPINRHGNTETLRSFMEPLFPGSLTLGISGAAKRRPLHAVVRPLALHEKLVTLTHI
jgi:hypothetical protein